VGSVFTTGSGQRYDNHRFYNVNFESLHNGMYLGGYDDANPNALGSIPRFESVANLIENRPRNLT